MRRISQAGIVLALLGLGAVAAELEYYGAIAYSDGTKVHGWATNHSSRKDAEAAALTACNKLAKNKDCRSVLWFRNACGALAIGRSAPGWHWAETQAAADLSALQLCSQHSRACTVQRRVCTNRPKPK